VSVPSLEDPFRAPSITLSDAQRLSLQPSCPAAAPQRIFVCKPYVMLGNDCLRAIDPHSTNGWPRCHREYIARVSAGGRRSPTGSRVD
jgi:hypothetical protein